VVVDWSGTLDLFYYQYPVTKITYDLNNAGFATLISVLFASGDSETCLLTYNENNQVTEMLISNWKKEHFKLFYNKNGIDSVSRETRFTDGTPGYWFGFYKSTPSYEEHTRRMISIYPFNQSQPYTTLDPSLYLGTCGYNTQSVTDNEFYKASYSIQDLKAYYNAYYNESSSGTHTSLRFKLPLVDAEGKRHNNEFEIQDQSSLDSYNQARSLRRTSWTDFECTGVYYGLNNFSLIPTLFPDAMLLEILVVTDELPAIYFDKIYHDNQNVSPLTELDIAYGYEPVKK
jgi:hypothetical protein